MGTKSLITCWIKNCDYPLYRRWLERHYNFFDEIIIYWSDHFRHMYFNRFIEGSLKHIPNIKFIPFKPYKYGYEDWRNVATNRMLDVATGDWIISIEQDFFTKDWNKLLSAVTEASKKYDFLGYKGFQGQPGQEHQDYLTGNYIHPSFWFIKRELLEKTCKDFSADPSRGCDHFGLITQDAEKMKISIWYTQDNGFPEENTFHQGGINVNYINAFEPGFVMHRPELFYIYNYWSMKANVTQSPEFMDLMKKIDAVLKEKCPNVDLENDERSVFYK